MSPSSPSPDANSAPDASVDPKAPDGGGAAAATEQPSVQEVAGAEVLHGTSVSPGLAVGRAYLTQQDLSGVPMRRVPRDGVERELNRFQEGLAKAAEQLGELKARLVGEVPPEHARILDTHLAYLKDGVFLSDVENLILAEQMALEAAIAKVILDFDRIFRLVESDLLRERAVDLRDVGIRVLKCLDAEDGSVGSLPPSGEYILVAAELTVVDVFGMAEGRVLGVVTEEGSLTSHAAILARSMRIPTLTGVTGLLETVRDGDDLVVDASEGLVRIRPAARVLEQFRGAAEDALGPVEAEALVDGPTQTLDGEAVALSAACGNLAEVETARRLGLTDVGLYRTELLFLLDREPPGLDALVAHYSAVLETAAGGTVTFRLADLDSSMGASYMHAEREANPALGLAGVRALLAHESILRRQLSAILRAGADYSGTLAIAVPKVVDCGDLRRVKEVLFEERYALRRQELPFAENLDVGAVIEVPAALFGIADLAGEVDFLALGLDSLQQYLLAADRDEPHLAPWFEALHPFVLRAIEGAVEVAEESGAPLRVFGVTAAQKANLPWLLTVGIRQVCVSPISLPDALEGLRATDLGEARKQIGGVRDVSSAQQSSPYRR